MSLGELALGIASIVMGVHHLSNGARRLGGFRGVEPPVRGRPFMDSGRRSVRTAGGPVSMQMRSYNIRTLDDRIGHLRRLVDEGKRDPRVYAFARRALTEKCGPNWCVPEKNNSKEALALFTALRGQVPPQKAAKDVATARSFFENLRKNVRYTSDIEGVDTYQKPSHTLALRSADCDDYATLTCAGLGSIGIPCRFKVIRTKGARDWNHIYAQAGLPRQNPTRWISLDGSVNMPFGWEAPKQMVAASRVFRVL
jgi:hypothetical protein